MTLIDYTERPSQRQILNDLDSALDEFDRVLVTASTGLGKTVVAAIHAATILTTKMYPGFKPSLSRAGWKCPVESSMTAPPQIFFVVHRNKLVRQTVKKFKEVFRSRFAHQGKFNENGLWDAVTTIDGSSSSTYQWQKPIVIVSQQALDKRIGEYLKKGLINPQYIYFDECHTTCSNPSGQELIERTAATCKKVIGLTATPFWRDAQKVAADYFDWAVCSKSFGELVASGELCPLHYFEPEYPETFFEEYRDFLGKIRKREVRCKYKSEAEIDYVVERWFKEDCENLKTICFAQDIKHADLIRERFALKGVKCDVISYKIPIGSRRAVFDGFEKGDTQILISIDSLGVGYDFQGIRCVMLLRETDSLALHWQQMGRGARAMVGKLWCKVLDFVKNIKRHKEYGIPDNIILTPELVMGKLKPTKRKGIAPTKPCPICEFVNFASARECSNPKKDEVTKEKICKHVFPVKTRISSLQVIPGDLYRIFVPSQTTDDVDIVAFFRSLRKKAFERGENPNLAIKEYEITEIGSRLKLPPIKEPFELREFTKGALTGNPSSKTEAKRLLTKLLQLRKKRPLRWTEPVIYSVIFLEFDEEIADEVNRFFLSQKLNPIDQIVLELTLA